MSVRGASEIPPASSPKRVVHLTSVHRLQDTRILHRECAALVEAGFDVALVAAHERDELINGVRIRALVQPRSRLQRWSVTVISLLRIARGERADLYHIHDPELLLLAPLLRAAGSKVVYDVHEDVGLQVLNKSWIPKILRRPAARLISWLERRVEHVVDAFVVATPAIARKFPPDRTIVVQNFPILDELELADPRPLALRRPVALYVGGLSKIRGVREMVVAMGLLPKSCDLKLILAGPSLPSELARELEALPGWERVELLAWQNRDEVRDLIGRARMGLVVLHPIPNYIESYPVKLFEYMVGGIPSIVSDFPLWRSIVQDAGCGLLVDPLDPASIADAMQQLLEDPTESEAMGSRARNAVLNLYNWRFEKIKLLQLYQQLLGLSLPALNTVGVQ